MVERAFATLYGRVRSLNNAARLTPTLQNGLWTEYANTATLINNISTTQQNTQPPFARYYRQNASLVNNLRSFGEQGIVKTAKVNQSKLQNRGELCIFVGYSNNHSNHTYCMLNLRTHKILLSCDIIWINRMFGDTDDTPMLPPTTMAMVMINYPFLTNQHLCHPLNHQPMTMPPTPCPHRPPSRNPQSSK